jgi:prolyl 4-hydroxylase
VLLPAFAMLQQEWIGEIEQLSWKPRAYLMRHFLSEEECDHIIGLVGKTSS